MINSPSDKTIFSRNLKIGIVLLLFGSFFLIFVIISLLMGEIYFIAPLVFFILFFIPGIYEIRIYYKKPEGIKEQYLRKWQIKQAKFARKYPSQQVPSQQPSPSSVGFSVQKALSKKDNLLIFMSYATKDADLFKISEIATKLTSYNEIGNVLYWQEDAGTSIIEYMEQNLNKCDILLLFCSPNSLQSGAVKKEYEAAQIMGKIMIPIFTDIIHVPTLLQPERGVKFDMFNLQNTIEEIYDVVKKKI
ncbi:MAG: toll/interleukin-1 receptor domain-containing protein [Promethearchaeota archaeon]